MISIICALAADSAIGYEGHLLYHLRDDLRRFKALTTGHTVIMGRRTFESLPKGALPNRRNIVLTRDATRTFAGAETFTDLCTALAACRGEEVFIIGGESVYAAALAVADRLYLTHIHATPEAADAYFPSLDMAVWQLTKTEPHEADAQNEVAFTFSDYTRKA